MNKEFNLKKACEIMEKLDILLSFDFAVKIPKSDYRIIYPLLLPERTLSSSKK